MHANSRGLAGYAIEVGFGKPVLALDKLEDDGSGRKSSPKPAHVIDEAYVQRSRLWTGDRYNDARIQR